MKFKIMAILSFFCILLITACDSKTKNDENGKKNEKSAKIIKKDFQLKTVDDELINISLEDNKIVVENYPNKIVLLNFFATWCPPCKAEIPNLIKLKNDYKNDFEVISILLEKDKDSKELNEFIKENKINFDVINSKENYKLAKSIGNIKAIPTMFLIGKNSKIFQRYVGIVPNEMMEIDIKKLLEK